MPDAPWACRAVRSTAKDVDACLAEAPVPGCPDRDVRGGLEGFGEVMTYGMRAGRDLLWGRFRVRAGRVCSVRAGVQGPCDARGGGSEVGGLVLGQPAEDVFAQGRVVAGGRFRVLQCTGLGE